MVDYKAGSEFDLNVTSCVWRDNYLYDYIQYTYELKVISFSTLNTSHVCIFCIFSGYRTFTEAYHTEMRYLLGIRKNNLTSFSLNGQKS